MQSDGFDVAVQVFLRANVVPEKIREPRLADRFVGIERHAVASAQGTVAAWRLGDGPAVLLVHGWQDDNSLWSPLVDVLAERGRAVVALDLPGHGQSEGEWGLSPQAADGIQAVAAALGPVDAVVGHSMGTGGVLFALNESLDVSRVVFVAPPYRSVDRWLRYAERLGVAHDVMSAARAIYEERIGAARTTFDWRAFTYAMDVDLLVVHSTDDERNPFEDSVELVRHCRRAELFAVQGPAHRRTARDPEVVRVIADYVTATPD